MKRRYAEEDEIYSQEHPKTVFVKWEYDSEGALFRTVEDTAQSFADTREEVEVAEYRLVRIVRVLARVEVEVKPKG